jgi:hypothetical protein
MLNSASKYKFVSPVGHTITGDTCLKKSDNIIRWEDVAWINEAAGELSAMLGVSGLSSYSIQPYLYAPDVQRVIDWCSSTNTATNSATGRHLSGWLPESSGWIKIKDYAADVTLYSAKENVYTVGEEASLARRVSRFAGRNVFPAMAASVSGGQLSSASIKAILQALPTHYQGIAGRAGTTDISVSGTFSVVDLAGGSPWGSNIVFTNNQAEPGDPFSWPSLYKNSAKYKQTAVGTPDVIVETDSTLGETATLETEIGANYAVLNYIGAEAIAVSYRHTLDGGTSRFSATTYYCQLYGDNYTEFNVATDLAWSTLKSLSAPAIPRPGTNGYITEGVVLFSLGGVAGLKFNCATAI